MLRERAVAEVYRGGVLEVGEPEAGVWEAFDFAGCYPSQVRILSLIFLWSWLTFVLLGWLL